MNSHLCECQQRISSWTSENISSFYNFLKTIQNGSISCKNSCFERTKQAMVWTNLHRTCAEILSNESEWRPDSDQWEVSGGVSLTTAECGDERVSAQCSSACQHTCSDQRISQVVGDYKLENEDDHRRVILNHQEEWQSMSEQDIDEINYKMSSFSSSFSTQAIMVNTSSLREVSWKIFFLRTELMWKAPLTESTVLTILRPVILFISQYHLHHQSSLGLQSTVHSHLYLTNHSH